MNYFFKIALAVLLQPQACNKASIEQLPKCINQKIAALKAEPKANPAAEVHLYNYNGKKVYLFNSPCCDQYNTAYDSECNYVCAPSGGITGKGDRKCLDFNATATYIKLVWKDDR